MKCAVLAFSLALATLSVANPSVPGFYRVDHAAGHFWTFVSPDNKPFWSFGVDCVEQGTSKDKYDATNPSYASFRLFPDDKSWAIDTLNKLRSWNFNTLGGWSDTDTLKKYGGQQMLPYTVVLHLGAYCKAPFDDIFTDKATDEMTKAAKDQIEPIKDDPMLLGYFTDNELGWWDDTLFLTYVKLLPADSPGRIRCHDLIKNIYHDDWDQFKRDWLTTNKDFDEFDAHPDLALKPGGNGAYAINSWMDNIGQYYYQTVYHIIKQFDRNHLIMGDRYCQYYNFQIAQAAGRYMDVVSTNMGADFNDGTFSPSYLQALHELSHQPIVISEFYMSAKENRSGNQNTSAAFPVVQTQQQRADAFAQNVKGLSKIPYVVGAHWFQFTDEPAKGRGDGENFNMGLVDTSGKPYDEMVKAAQSIDTTDKRMDGPPDRENTEIPHVTSDPMAAPSLKAWPRQQAYVTPKTKLGFADMYCTQDDQNLYLGLYATNYIDESIYQDGKIPESERPLWRISINGSPPLDVRFGGSYPNKGKPIPCTVSFTDVKAIEAPNLRHTVILRIPWTLFGGKPDSISLAASLQSHSRGYSMSWQTSLRP